MLPIVPPPRPHEMWVICGCLIAILAVPAAGQDRPLPDSATFMAEARKRLEADDVRQSEYVYVETQRERKLDASGASMKETLDVFESYPALPNESRWRRQTVKNGKPVPPEDLAKVDRERQQKVLEYAKKLERNPEKVREAERKKHDEERRDSERAVDDVLRVYDITMLGREVVSGYETIVLSFTPRKDARPQTSEGKIMRHFAGKAWVSESEYRGGTGRGRGDRDGVVRTGAAGSRAQGIEGRLRAPQGERRAVVAGSRHLHRQRAGDAGEGDARRRHVGVLGLPQVQRPDRHEDRQAAIVCSTELLKGDRAGRHSIRVNEQYRVTFGWENGHAYEVRVEDYH